MLPIGNIMEKFLDLHIPQDYTDKIKHTKPIKKLSFGKRKIVLSEEELEKLETEYHKYADMFGVELGFVHYLLNNFREAL